VNTTVIDARPHLGTCLFVIIWGHIPSQPSFLQRDLPHHENSFLAIENGKVDPHAPGVAVLTRAPVGGFSFPGRGLANFLPL